MAPGSLAPGPMAPLGKELTEMLDYYCASSLNELNPEELSEQFKVITDYVQTKLLSKTWNRQDGKATKMSRLSRTLHEAAQRGHQEVISVTLSYLELSRRFVLLVQDEYTPLHDAANSGHSNCVKALLTLLKPEHQLVLLTKKSNGKTAANLATYKENEYTATVLKEHEEAAERHIKVSLEEAIRNYCGLGLSVMKDIERFGDLLFAVSLSESMEILKWKRDVFSYTPLEYASIRGHAELITTILSSLPQSKRLGLLLGDGYTPLHFAATRGDTECVKAILTPLTSKQQLKLIEKVHEGLTASDGAAIYQKADIVCLLHFFQLKAELQISSEESELGCSDERRPMQHLQDLLIHEREKTTQQEEQITQQDEQKTMLQERITQLQEQITQLSEIICEMRTELDRSRPNSNDLPESENNDQSEASSEYSDDNSSGSWKSLSNASDVESIPENVTQLLSLFHEETHESLHALADDSSSFLTCTIVSHHPPDKDPYHLLAVSEGYRRSVASYISNHKDHVLKVTTYHVKSASLESRFEQHLEAFPHALIALFPDKRILDNAIQPESPLCADDGKVKYRYRSIGIEFSSYDSSVQIAVYYDTILDSVQGSINEIMVDNEFPDIAKPLKALDDPESNDVVTVILMAVEGNSGELKNLYKFIAGDIKENPEDFGANWILCKVKFTNDKLYKQIEKQCRQHFLCELDEELRNKWERESPLFVVTAAPPILVEGGHYDFVPIAAQLPGSSTEQTLFTFRHPANCDIYFDVHRPASPSKVVAHPEGCKGKASRSISMGTVSQDATPSQPKAKQTRNELLCQQQTVTRSLRQAHKVNGIPSHAITAVISTVTNPDRDQDVFTSIILVSGIVRGTNQMDTQASNRDHSVLSFSWIYDKNLRELVDKKWSDCVKDSVRKSWPACAMVTDYRNYRNLKGPMQRNGVIGFKTRGIWFENNGPNGFIIGSAKENVRPYHHLDFADEKAYQKSLLPEENLKETWDKAQVEVIAIAKQMIKRAKGKQMIDENAEDITSLHTGITITAVEACYTPLPPPRPHRIITNSLVLKKEIVYVVSIADKNGVGTPRDFKRHDVLNLMRCQTWSENNPKLAHLVETYWQTVMTKDENGNPRKFDIDESTGEPCKKANHMIIHFTSNEYCNTSFDHKNFVRFPKKKERYNMPFEIYSHECDTGSLFHILDPTERERLKDALSEANPNQPITDDLFPDSRRPNSFKYPTIKISVLGLTGMPSYVGTHTEDSHSVVASTSGESVSSEHSNLEGASTSRASVSSEGSNSEVASTSGASASSGGSNSEMASTAGASAGVQCFYQRNQDETHMTFSRPGTIPNVPTVESVINILNNRTVVPKHGNKSKRNIRSDQRGEDN